MSEKHKILAVEVSDLLAEVKRITRTKTTGLMAAVAAQALAGGYPFPRLVQLLPGRRQR